MSNDKKYVGSGKEFGSYGGVNISIEVTNSDFKEAIFEYNGKKYVKLVLDKRREPDQYGKTHTLYLNEYVPEEKQEEASDEMPF